MGCIGMLCDDRLDIHVSEDKPSNQCKRQTDGEFGDMDQQRFKCPMCLDGMNSKRQKAQACHLGARTQGLSLEARVEA